MTLVIYAGQKPEAIPPYVGEPCSTVEGYFSLNLESVRKDVECTFWILKKRWKILNGGFIYCDIQVCEKIFIACACLHNFLANDTVRYNFKVGRGNPIGNNGIWLGGQSAIVDNKTDHFLATQFGRRRLILANHLSIFR